MKELDKMMSKRDDIAERYDTDDSEVFPFVWNRLQEALLEGIEILSEDTAVNPEALPLVAHNACFDSRCLREVIIATGWTIRNMYSTILLQQQEHTTVAHLKTISFRQ